MAIEIYGIPVIRNGEIHTVAVDRETFLAYYENLLSEKY